MNIRIAQYSATLIFALASFAYSQSMSIGVGSSLLFVQSPSFYTNPTSVPGIYRINGIYSYSEGLAFTKEFQIDGAIDYRFRELPLGITLELNYAFLRGHGDSYIRFPYSDESVPTKLTTKLDVMTVSLGASYYVITGNIAPFLSANIQFNRFGELSFRYEYYSTWEERKGSDAVNRLGLGVGAGVDCSLGSDFSIRVFTSYAVHNVSGRESGEEPFRSLNLGVIFLHSLLH